MSVDVRYIVQNVVIPMANVAACAATFRTQLEPLLQQRGTHVSRLDMPEHDDQATVINVLQRVAQFGARYLQPEYGIALGSWHGDSNWVEDAVFYLMAPYVRHGGFIDAMYNRGEEFARILFIDGEVHRCPGKVEYAMPWESPRLVPYWVR